MAVFAMLFGLLTILSGGRVLLGPEEARLAAGHYVPLVLWFNFLAGFAYIAAAWGIWWGRRWACPLATGIAVTTLAVFAIFGLMVATGTPFEMRTVGAMTLRSGFWFLAAFLVCRRCRRRRREPASATATIA